MKANTSSNFTTITTNLTKQRLVNIIEMDRRNGSSEVSKDPLQPYMEFIMDVSAMAIKQHSVEKEFTVQSPSNGLKFQIKQLEPDDLKRNRYEIKLFNANELRFSAIVLNTSLVEPNQWYFTSKYEDTISPTDIKQFIKAAALVYGKVKTKDITNETELVELTMNLVKNGAKKYKYDNTISLACQWVADTSVSTDVIRPAVNVELIAQNIILARFEFLTDENQDLELASKDIMHPLPSDVVASLANTIRKDAANFLSNKMEKRTIARQNAFYQSNRGQFYQEATQLNDVFRAYTAEH